MLKLQNAILVVLQGAFQIAQFFLKRLVDCFQLAKLGIQNLQNGIFCLDWGYGNVDFRNGTEAFNLGNKGTFALGNLAFLYGDFPLEFFNLGGNFVNFDVDTHRFQQLANGFCRQVESIQTLFDFRNVCLDCAKFVCANGLFARQTLQFFVQTEQLLVQSFVLFVQGCNVLQLGVDGFDTGASVLDDDKLVLLFVQLGNYVCQFRFQTFDVQSELVTALFVILALVGDNVQSADFWQKCQCLVAQLKLLAHKIDFLLAGNKFVVLLLSNFQFVCNVLTELGYNQFCL